MPWSTRHHAIAMQLERAGLMSETSETLASALVAALADLTVIDPARTADMGSYSYKYADLADVVKLTRPVLAAHGLVALTPVHDHGGGLACTVILLHTSGEKLELGPFPFPHGRDAQATGSMVTYHRRYALVAALGMAAGDDDDGASAAPRQTQAQPKPFDLAGFHRACADADVDPLDVLAHAQISKPFAALDVEDRPLLAASLKELAAKSDSSLASEGPASPDAGSSHPSKPEPSGPDPSLSEKAPK